MASHGGDVIQSDATHYEIRVIWLVTKRKHDVGHGRAKSTTRDYDIGYVMARENWRYYAGCRHHGAVKHITRRMSGCLSLLPRRYRYLSHTLYGVVIGHNGCYARC